jgi:hypothetical protein
MIANRGTFFVVLRRDVAERGSVKEFVEWLRHEARSASALSLAPPRETKRSTTRQGAASSARVRARRV